MIALVHDYLNQYGGAERVVAAFHRRFPEAPIYTSVYDPARMPPEVRSWPVRTTWLQGLPGLHRLPWARLLLPLYPLAFESLDLSPYRLVLSSSSAFAKGVVTGPETLHVCYCHTPMRFAWQPARYLAREGIPAPLQGLLGPILHYLRLWDQVSARRVDRFLCNSRLVARRIRKLYGREATVLPPPVDVERFRPQPRATREAFLVVGRLVPYRRLDVVVEAFNRLKLPLWIVGEGRDRPRLEALAGPTVRFWGRVDDRTLADLYARTHALIFPGEEDFGLVPLEAMASGRPVLAYGAGGALETVVPGVTGRFFFAQTPEAIVEAVRAFRAEEARYDPVRIRRWAETFALPRFLERLEAVLAAAWRTHFGRPWPFRRR